MLHQFEPFSCIEKHTFKDRKGLNGTIHGPIKQLHTFKRIADCHEICRPLLKFQTTKTASFCYPGSYSLGQSVILCFLHGQKNNI